jgi:hypothetical protein
MLAETEQNPGHGVLARAVLLSRAMGSRYVLGGLLLLSACSSGEPASSPGTGGNNGLDNTSGGLSGGNSSGGSTIGGHGGSAGSASGEASGSTGTGTGGSSAGAGGSSAGSGGVSSEKVPCGSAGLLCEKDALCVETSLYPNNVDPNNIRPPSTSWACVTNPCGTQTLSCDCARSACQYPECSVSANKLVCVFRAICTSPETLIATPSGERRIADLRVGDLVYSVDGAALRPVPIVRATRTPVSNHHVMEVRMADGSVMEISSGHPTADGRLFGDLQAGDRLDGALIRSSRLIDYRYPYTYDILPGSDSGTYVAFGKLIGSTLK